jgi:hypothetical protein
MVEQTEERKQRLEEQKMALDYIKHVSTLATSAIVISLAFSGQLANRSWNWLFVPGIGGQLLCLAALVVAAIGIISAGRSVTPPGRFVVGFTVIGTAVGLFCFLLGVTALAIFLIRNLV